MDEPILYVDRKGTHCEKWDGLGERFGREDLLALWVADMDFRVPQCVLEAEKDYLDTGVFGYYHPSEGYYQALWIGNRNVMAIRCSGNGCGFPRVVPAINWLIQIFTEPQDRVLVLTPVYYPFLHAVRDNDRTLVACQLVHQDGQYTVDLAAFEAAIAENQVRMFIMSSPHNPVSRVWRREELTAMLDICKKHGVLVLSDEIHQDLTFDGHKHIPSATAGDYSHMVITLTAASKTFNLAGCQMPLWCCRTPSSGRNTTPSPSGSTYGKGIRSGILRWKQPIEAARRGCSRCRRSSGTIMDTYGSSWQSTCKGLRYPFGRDLSDVGGLRRLFAAGGDGTLL